MAANRSPKADTPKLRLRLRTVLIVVSLLVLMLPIVGLYFLRLHENTLLQQTQTQLAIVADLVSASYRVAFERWSPAEPAPARIATMAAAQAPQLDFGNVPVKPPFPSPRPSAAAGPLARRVGDELALALTSAKANTGAAIRLLDREGVVVATTEGDLGQSLAHADEVREALDGSAVSSLRRVPSGAERIEPIVRGVGVEVLLALPIVAGAEVVGAVTVSRRPSNILDTLAGKRVLLTQGAAVFIAVALAVALITARTLVLPIKRLTVGVGRVTRGETDRFEGGRPYRVYELADLAESVETMVSNLQRRAGYLRDFAHQLNHEYKTPVAAARGALELLRDHLDGMAPAEAKRFVDNAAADIDRLDRLTMRMLDLAQADMAQVTDEVVDIRAQAQELSEAQNTHIDLHVAAGPPVYAKVSHSSLQAVLENLVDNARRHGASRADIWAETDAADRDAVDAGRRHRHLRWQSHEDIRPILHHPAARWRHRVGVGDLPHVGAQRGRRHRAGPFHERRFVPSPPCSRRTPKPRRRHGPGAVRAVRIGALDDEASGTERPQRQACPEDGARPRR